MNEYPPKNPNLLQHECATRSNSKITCPRTSTLRTLIVTSAQKSSRAMWSAMRTKEPRMGLLFAPTADLTWRRPRNSTSTELTVTSEKKLLFNSFNSCVSYSRWTYKSNRHFIVNPMRDPARCANRLNDLNFRALWHFRKINRVFNKNKGPIEECVKVKSSKNGGQKSFFSPNSTQWILLKDSIIVPSSKALFLSQKKKRDASSDNQRKRKMCSN